MAAGDTKLLCDVDCVARLESAELVTTPSGLQYREITVGTGPQAEVRGMPISALAPKPIETAAHAQACGVRWQLALNEAHVVPTHRS